MNGIFYADTEKELKAELKGLFADADVPEGSAFAIVSPHAGYNYSGRYSAAAFLSAARRSIRTAVILAPVHHDPEPGIFLPESELFTTPLGQVQVDLSLIGELARTSSLLQMNDIPHLEEHCVEIQLPFIQYIFPGASIVPILVGKIDETGVRQLSESLQTVFRNRYEETLFVVSSNLTTYKDFAAGQIEAQLFLDLLMKNDIHSLIRARLQDTISACGAFGVAAMLSFRDPVLKPILLSRGDSSSGNGDVRNGVHYAALALSAGGDS